MYDRTVFARSESILKCLLGSAKLGSAFWVFFRCVNGRVEAMLLGFVWVDCRGYLESCRGGVVV